jgi:CBS domain-containing protein
MSQIVKDYMNRNVATVSAEAFVVQASKIMMENHSGYLIVLEKTQPVGIVTENDLVVKVMAKEREPSNVRVSEVMSAPLIIADPDTTVQEAARTMAKHGIRRLPVVRDNHIHGIFTTRDLTKHLNEFLDRVVRDITSVALIPQYDASEVGE